MLQVENKTRFVPGLFVFPDAKGVDTAYVVIKGTFECTPGGVRVAETQMPLVLRDEFSGEPGKSSLKRASEAHLTKPSTDLVVLGSAHAPGGRPVPVFDLSVAVGAISKRLRVFGDRVWSHGAPSEPRPVAAVPLTWERAFGGVHVVNEKSTLYEARNPVGVGFAGKRSSRDLEGKPLPNLEDPADLLQKVGQQPAPAGVGFVASSWEPRVGHAGSYDGAWQKKRAPYLPDDFDSRYFQAAAPALVTPKYLGGGEPVELLNLSPAGRLKFALPTVEFGVTATKAGVEHALPMNLESVVFEPDRGFFCMLWRGALSVDKQALRLESVRFEATKVEGVIA